MSSRKLYLIDFFSFVIYNLWNQKILSKYRGLPGYFLAVFPFCSPRITLTVPTPSVLGEYKLVRH